MPPQHGQGEEEVAQITYRPERSPVPGRKDCRGQQRHGHRVMDLVPEVDGGRAQQGETDPVPQGGQRMQPPPPPSPLPPLRDGSEGEGAAHAAHSFHFHWPVRQGWWVGRRVGGWARVGLCRWDVTHTAYAYDVHTHSGWYTIILAGDAASFRHVANLGGGEGGAVGGWGLHCMHAQEVSATPRLGGNELRRRPGNKFSGYY